VSRFPQGRPRKLSKYRERVMLEEVRMGRYFAMKKIAERYDLTRDTLNEYVRRAAAEGRL